MKTTYDNPMNLPDSYFEEKARVAEESLGFFQWQEYLSEVSRLIGRDGGEVTTAHPTKSATVHQRLEALSNLELLPAQENGGAE